MIERTIDEVVKFAEEAHASGKKWHFHILAPTCCFNVRKDRYGLVLEVPTEGITLVAYATERPAEEGKKLVALLHGAKVLSGTGASSETTHEIASEIVQRARKLNEHKIAWHHHMLFPDCALNSHAGKWNLIFEDPESGETLSALYDDEPIQDLKEVEVLFYAIGTPAS